MSLSRPLIRLLPLLWFGCGLSPSSLGVEGQGADCDKVLEARARAGIELGSSGFRVHVAEWSDDTIASVASLRERYDARSHFDEDVLALREKTELMLQALAAEPFGLAPADVVVVVSGGAMKRIRRLPGFREGVVESSLRSLGVEVRNLERTEQEAHAINFLAFGPSSSPKTAFGRAASIDIGGHTVDLSYARRHDDGTGFELEPADVVAFGTSEASDLMSAHFSGHPVYPAGYDFASIDAALDAVLRGLPWERHADYGDATITLAGGVARSLVLYASGERTTSYEKIAAARSLMASTPLEARGSLFTWSETALRDQELLSDTLDRLGAPPDRASDKPSGRSSVQQLSLALAFLRAFGLDKSPNREVRALLDSTLARAAAYGFFDSEMP